MSLLLLYAGSGGSTTIFADDFNRANGELSSPWTYVGGTSLAVSSNKAVGDAGYNVDLATAAYTVSVDVQPLSGAPRLVFRFVDDNNFWSIQVFSDFGFARLNRRVAGVEDNMGSVG